MRYVYPAAATGVVLAFFIMAGRGVSSSPSITNYQLVSEERITRTEWYYTYRADLVNPGQGRASMTASVTSPVPGGQIVPGRGVLHFAPVPTNGTVTSSDTFTVMVDRNQSFSLSDLQWAFLSPTANAGVGQTVAVGAQVLLNGSGSADPGLAGPLSYLWAFKARPFGSNATLVNPTSVMPSFVADLPGRYAVGLTVSNGAGSDSADVFITTVNSPPVASAGAGQTVAVGASVTLNGSGSSDVDGDPLTYKWTLITRPAGSGATLQNPLAVVTSFSADKIGTYVAQLVVNDGTADSIASTVTITTQNAPPVANPGANQVSVQGSIIQLDGSGSTDVDGDPLTYKWSFVSKPAASTAVLSNSNNVSPTFTADASGTYVVQLIVNDGKVDSTPATTTITTSATQAPTANAGPNQTVVHGTSVNLAGSGTDPQGKPLTYLWSLVTRPPSSTAALSSTSIAAPTFLADRPGTYVAQLIVSNGVLSSPPSTVTITTTNTPPVAVAGPGQIAVSGATVVLDGNGSSDADSDPLTYAWSLNSRPADSSAVLVSPLSKTPTLTVDAAGTYVVQLIVNDGFTNSNPVTTTITVNTMAIMLTPNPLNLTNSPKLLRVTLGAPAGAGGQGVNLQGFDPTIVTLATRVVVPEGSTGIDVTVTPVAGGSTMILATSVGFQAGSVTVNVNTPTISVSLGASGVGLTRTVSGMITLSSPAPASGTTVSIAAAPAGIVSLDTASVFIGAGNTTGTFVVTGVSAGVATISGSSAGYISGNATIVAAMLGSISMPAEVTLTPGQIGSLDVRLTAPAPQGGVMIQLSSSDLNKVTVDPQVFIAHGNMLPASMPQVTGIGFGSAVITASAPGLTGANQTVKVGGALSFSSPTITVGAGGTQNVTLLLTAPAPAVGLTVNINSSNPAVALVPAQVTFGPNQTSTSVLVSGLTAGSSTLTTTSGVPTLTNATATVSVAVFGAINLSSNLAVDLGGTIPFPVTLSSTAPANGVTVQLTTSDSSTVSLPTSSVFIEAGKTQPTVQPLVAGANLGQATVTATAPGYGSSSAVVKTKAALGFSQSSTTLTGTETKDVTITLSAAAPNGGVPVSLSASQAGVVTIPANVVIPQGATSKVFSVTGVAVGTVSITATSPVPNVASATTSITVQSAGSLSIQSGVNLTPGQALDFDVTLPAAAVSDVTVNLTSADPTKVTVSPSSVTIGAGQTQPSPKPKATGVNFGSTAINASAAGYGATSQIFTVGATMTLTPTPLLISGTATQDLTLTLSANAPSGGLAVNLSVSPSGIVTIPANVLIPAGAATVKVPVTGVVLGSATITAAAATAPNVPSTTASVTVQSAGGLTLPAGVTVAPGASAPFVVVLPAAAPSAVTVTFASNDETIAKVLPLTLVIPAGQTQVAAQPVVTGFAFGTAAITASAPGYSSTTQSVKVGATLAFTPQPLTISGTETQDLTLTLSANAPSNGLAVNLSVSPSGIVTIPANVTIPAGAATVKVPVTGVALGSVTITAAAATAPNVPNATASVTVQSAGGITLPVGVTVAPGASAPFTVVLPSAAPSAVTVTFTSSDETKVKVSPATLVIPAGQTQVAGQPVVTGFGFGAATITASAPGFTSTSQSVKVGATMAFTPQPLSINGTATQDLTLTLSANAPAGGVAVSLSVTPAGIVTIPATVTIAEGVATVKVPVTGVVLGTATITASTSSLNVPNATASVTVQNAGTINLQQNVTVALNQSAPLAVSLSIAPAVDTVVALVSSDTAKLTISPASVTIPAGQTVPQSQPQVTGKSLGTATINATAPFYAPASRAVQITGSISFSPQNLTITGTETQNLTLTLSGPAPTGGLAVSVGSSNTGVATVTPASFTVPENQTTVTVPVKGVTPGSAVVTASAPNMTSGTAAITVNAPIDIIIPASLTVAPSQQLPFPVSLARTRANDVTISLASSDPTIAAPSVTSVLIPANSLQPTRAVNINGLKAGTVTITATATDLLPATSTVKVQYTMTLSPATLNLAGIGMQQSITVNLSAPAPPEGLVISLTSSDTNVATLRNQTVPISGGSSSVGFQVVSAGPGSTIIRANSPGIAEATSTVTVGAQGTLTLSANPSFLIGQTIPLTVTLSTPAPAGGVTVSLVSSDPAKATVTPPSVLIPEGGLTTSAFSLKAINVGNVTFSATAPNYVPASRPVSVNGVLAWETPSLTISGIGKVGQLILDLPLPLEFAEGVLANLSSSNPNVVTVQQSIWIWSDGSSQGRVIVLVTSTGVGTAQIHASAINTPDVAATVTVTGPPAITTDLLPDGMQNVDYVGAMAAAGGVPPYTWSATGLPGNVQLNAAGQFSGKPTAIGNSSVLFTVSDSSTPAQTATKTLTLKVTAAPPPASVTIVDGNNQSAKISTAFTLPLKVSVKDANGNPVAGTLVTFTPPASGIGGSFAPPNTAVTDALGIAVSTQFSANTLVGSYQVVASVLQGSPSATFNLTNTVGSAASIAVHGGSGQTATINTAFTTPLQAIVKDAGGNPVSNITVTFAAPAGTPSGSFTGPATAVTDASGVATANVFTANSKAGTYSVTATAPDIATPASFSLTNAAGAAAVVVATDGTPQSAPINTPFTKTLKVLVKDGFDNPVSGAQVTFTPSTSTPDASGAFAGGNTATTDANGAAESPVFTANGHVGSYTVIAGTGRATSATFTLTNLPGAAATVAIVDGNPQNATINTAYSTALKVQVKDALNNTISGASVVFTIIPAAGGASGAFAASSSVQTDALGIATAPQITANAIAGTFSVTANASGVVSAPFLLTNKAGAVASIAISDGTPQSTGINSPFVKRLKVLVKDASNNGVMNATVTFTAPAPTGPSGTFTGGIITAITDAAGIATSEIFTANDKVGSYQVTAKETNLASTVSFDLTNTAGSPKNIVVSTGSNQNAKITTDFANPLRALVTDANSNPVSNVDVAFTVVPVNGAGGSFVGGVTTAKTDASGIATSALFTANGKTGTYTVAASVPLVSPDAVFTLTNTPGPAATMTFLSGAPQTATVNTAFSNVLRVTVKDASNNGVGGVTVLFAPPPSGASGAFGASNSVTTDPSGVATSPVFTANTIAGTYNVTASSAGLTSVDFLMTNAPGLAASITGVGGTGQSALVSTAFALPLQAQVKDAFGNNLVGAQVSFAAPGGQAPGGTFAGGTVTYPTNAQGIATSNVFTANANPGNYNVTATTPNAAGSATFAMTNTPASTGTGIITLSSPTIGKDLQAPINIHLSPAAAQGAVLTVTSSNPALALLGASGGLGTGTVSTTLSEGTADISTYVKALTGTGTVTITVSATGYVNSTATITFAPSGFVISGSSGIGGNFTTYKGVKTNLTVFAARLNGAGQYVENQEVRGGITASVPVASVPTTVGTISPGLVSIAGGASTGTAQFTASSSNTGTATITASAPAGFTTPASGATLVATVEQSGIVPFTATVGKNLQVPVSVTLTGPTTSEVQMKVLSLDSSKLKFSATDTGAGLAEITVTIPANRIASPVFYVQGFANANTTASYRIDITGLGTVDGTVTVAPSGFVIESFAGIGGDFGVVAGAGSPGFDVLSARLSAGGGFVEAQALAGGLTASVPLTVGTPSIGLVNPSSVAFSGGQFRASSEFQPSGVAGTTTIVANPPLGYTAATQGTVNATVQSVVMVTPTDPIMIGNGLQMSGFVRITVPAPSDLVITLTSANASLVKLSATPTGAGAGVTTIKILAGTQQAFYYVQGASSSGITSFTISAPGFPDKTRQVTLAPSGVLFDGDINQSWGLNWGPMPLSLYTAMLDPTTLAFLEYQALAGGPTPLSVVLNSSNPAAGTVSTPVDFIPGQSTASGTFTPIAKLTTTVSIVGTPLGSPGPVDSTTVNITVN